MRRSGTPRASRRATPPERARAFRLASPLIALALLIGVAVPVDHATPASALRLSEDARGADATPTGEEPPSAPPGDGAPEQPSTPEPDPGEASPEPSSEASPEPDEPAPEEPAPDPRASRSGPASLSGASAPDEDVPEGTGPEPRITSTWTPDGGSASGEPRTFTVSYENDKTAPISNARLWHQFMIEAAHDTTYTVSCASTPAGSCPDWVPTGALSLSGQSGEYANTFAGVADLAIGQKLTFTIVVTPVLDTAVCSYGDTVMIGGWARFGRAGFEAPDDIVASASSAGQISGATPCPNGSVTMTNTVTSPGPAGNPSRVLSSDARVFTATWRNTSSGTLNVPISYRYYVPLTGHVTEAAWTCTPSGGASCPDVGGTSRTIVHDHAGEAADTVFSGTATLPAGATLTYAVTLATTLNACTQDGYLRVQTYASRGAAPEGETGFRSSAPSPLVEIGCSTWMLDEDFSGTSVDDPGWRGLSQACLTRAPSGSTPANGLGYCSNRVNSPATSFQAPVGTPKGFLQLTDDSNDKVGAALYNRALPSQDGLVVEFTSYQYGNDSGGADGIGFFLSDGSYNLTQPGDSGGALGYAYRPSGTSNVYNTNGLAHGYLGVGLDVYGNFVNTSHAAPTSSCDGSSSLQTPQSVGLRGPGNLRSGYCLVGQNQISASPLSKTLDHPSAGIPASGNSGYDAGVRTALDAAKRKVRVTVHPMQQGETNPRVTVEIDFNEGYFRTVIDQVMPQPVPPLIKFGFLGATGGSKQAHLIDAVRVGTVLPMKELSLTKAVDYENSTPRDEGKTGFDAGDTVSYKFVVHNATSEDAVGLTEVYNIAVTDPLIPNIVCPTTTLDRFESMECTGSLTVTEGQRDAGRIPNTATAVGSISSSEGAPRNLRATSSATVPVNPEADPALRVIAPGGTAAFQVIKHGSTLGIVRPDDPNRLTLEVWNGSAWVPAPASGSTSIAASNGTWSVDANRRVTFVHNGGSNHTVTPLRYRVSNLYGGWDESTLSVNISTVPTMACTVDQSSESDRFWGFGTAARFDFGGTTLAGAMPDLSSTHGSFTVTDSKGKLLFVVDSGTGAANSAVIRTSTGAPMAGSSVLGSQLIGASPVAVIPAGQGTSRFIVITTSATATGAGQLSWRSVDMALAGGLGLVGGATAFGGTAASTAVTAVPNADGTGYWVLSPRRGNANIDAHLFDASGYTGTSRASSVGTNTAASNPNYEDIRYNAGLARSSGVAQFAVLASASTTSRVRLMSFDAATGSISGVGTNRTFTNSSNTHGYSLDFSPGGGYLFASRNGSVSGTAGVLYRATVTATSLGNNFGSVHATAPSSNNGGAVRLGANGSLYWAQSNTATVRVKSDPNASTSTWANQSLASGTISRLGLSNTLVDCAIPAAEFWVEKYASDGTTLTGGASFALFPDENGAVGSTPVSPGVQPVSGQPGRFTATGIPPGAYWLRETAALPGHQLLTQDVLINVSLGGVIAVDALPNPQVTLVRTGAEGDYSYTLRVVNTRSVALPLSGGSGFWLLIVGGVLLAAVLAGIVWWRRRQAGRAALADGAPLPDEPRGAFGDDRDGGGAH
ncbi:hypothetical protein J4H92_07080 [Leucobacter weissii]|uniref:Prealbumin-like fold domain-containing protein n=1 Tax=Leucobacter weissii TaxID=1983706 RepID=A0A939MNJ1_9MICO|nr:SpaA isopeptide-forming pilin-related protein [Leucobacter weissii]MBO1901716.1 hypothetical protein [Leucobacter weissii]